MSAQTAISIERLSKAFGPLEVLRDIYLDVPHGDIVVVIGPSGAGKSTLLRCINGLTPFESGTITVLGNRVTGIGTERGDDRRRGQALARIRSAVGMVFQSFNLFPHLTVLQNIALAPMEVRGLDRHTAESEALELLLRVGLDDKAGAYPRRLSGGQQQRAAICRALAMRPEIMLFDEVTSMLDPELVGEVLKVMKDLTTSGMTMVVVTHEMAFARDVASTIVMMADGAVVEVGVPEVIFNAPQEERTRLFLRRVLEKEKAL